LPKLCLLNSIKILAIESSCDDTGAAVIVNGEIRSNVIANQEVHKEYGGVVPELASRAHQKNIIPVVDTALKRAGVDKNELSAIAVTKGPGLLGALLVGTTFAKTMAMVLNIPIIGVHHMQAHVLAHFIDNPNLYFLKKQSDGFIDQHLLDLCASVQRTIVTILMKELVKACKQYSINHVAIAGGVSANSELRRVFEQTGKQKGWQTYIPKFEYCTDNAAMIAIAGHYQFLQGNFEDQNFSPVARWKV